MCSFELSNRTISQLLLRDTWFATWLQPDLIQSVLTPMTWSWARVCIYFPSNKGQCCGLRAVDDFLHPILQCSN